MFYNSTTVLFKINNHFNIKNHFNKFKTKRDISFTSFNLSNHQNLYITILLIKAVNLLIMRKHHLLIRLMLISNNLTKLLTHNLVVTVLMLKLNFHSTTKETLISHKKLLQKKLIYKTHKMIFIQINILIAVSHPNKLSINHNKKIFFLNKNLIIKTLNSVSGNKNLMFNDIFTTFNNLIIFFTKCSRN